MEWINSFISDLNNTALIISLVALIVAGMSLFYTIRTFWLKSGIKVRFSYSSCSSMASQDKYVSSITIENLKDRAIVIFAIYLEMGRGLYLKIEEFEDKPLIISPFEVYQKEFDPVYLYNISMKRVDINHLFENKAKILYLSTTEGKYKVKSYLNIWNPIIESLTYKCRAVINPLRVKYKDKNYGNNILFILDLKHEDGNNEIIPIYRHHYNVLRNAEITHVDIASKESLNNFMAENIENGKLKCNSYEVIEWLEYREKTEKEFGDRKILNPVGRFIYFLGWVIGVHDSLKRKLKRWKQTRH